MLRNFDDIALFVSLPCYRVHPINVQLVTDPVIMPAKEEHRCDSGSESLDKQDPLDILHCHVERCDQSFVIVCTAVVGNVLRTSVCTSPTVLEAEVLWSGLEYVMMFNQSLDKGLWDVVTLVHKCVTQLQ
jgi:hypothetical protein